MSRVLIVGGAGYVGGWLTDEALAAGHECRVYDALLYEHRYLKAVDFVAGDVLDRSRLRPHLEWADTVIWLAAIVGDPACALDDGLTQAINLGSVRWLTSVFGGRIIFPSTCSVYGAQEGLLDEHSPLNPLSLYAETKLAAEQVLLERPGGALIFRLATLAGVGDTYSRIRLDLVVNLLTVRAMTVRRLTVFGGDQFRPFLHVRDVATAMVPHIDHAATGIYNLGCENITIRGLADRIIEIVGQGEIEQVDVPFQDSRNYRVSTERAARELGFAPCYSLDDSITEVHDLVVSGRIRELDDTTFSNLESLRPMLAPERIPLGREVSLWPSTRMLIGDPTDS